jgi:hypothetical protein
MQVVLTTPAPLVGQSASGVFDPGLAGTPRGSGPSGALGSTITVPSQYLRQAIDAGFVVSSWVYG